MLKDKYYYLYKKYKREYKGLKQLKGGQRQFSSKTEELNKLKKQINFINVILYSQFSYLKRKDYIDYCLTNIWHYMNYIPGKYFTNILNFYPNNILTDDYIDKLKVFLHDPEKIIVGWKLPPEQRIHNYKLQITYNSYSFTLNQNYEIDFTNYQTTPNYYLINKSSINKITLIKNNEEIHTINEFPNFSTTIIKAPEPIFYENNITHDYLFNQLHNLIILQKDIYNKNIATNLTKNDKKDFLNDNNTPKYINKLSYETNSDILELNKYMNLLFNNNYDKRNRFLLLFYTILFFFTKEKNIKYLDLHKKFDKQNKAYNLQYTLSKFSSRMTLLHFISDYDNQINIQKQINHISLPEFTTYKNSDMVIEYAGQAAAEIIEDTITPSTDIVNLLFQQTDINISFIPEEDRTTEQLQKQFNTLLTEAEKDNFFRKYSYFYDSMSNSIIVSIAGTDNASDWLTNLNINKSLIYTGDGSEEEYTDFDKLETTDEDTENNIYSFSNIKNFNGYDNFPLLITQSGFTSFAQKIFKQICIKDCPDEALPIIHTTNNNLLFRKNFCKYVSNELRNKYKKDVSHNKKPLLEFYYKIKEKLSPDKAQNLQITFTGHSLGSATAQCLYLLCYFNKDYRQIRQHMKFIGLSSPRLNHIYTSRNFKRTVDQTKIIHVYHTQDPIPFNPHMSSALSQIDFFTIPNIIKASSSIGGVLTGIATNIVTTAATGGLSSTIALAQLSMCVTIGNVIGQHATDYLGYTTTDETVRNQNAKSSIWYHGGNLIRINTNETFEDPKANYYSHNHSILIDAHDLQKNNFNISNLLINIKKLTEYHYLKNLIKPLSNIIMDNTQNFSEGSFEISTEYYNTLTNSTIQPIAQPITQPIAQSGVGDDSIIQDANTYAENLSFRHFGGLTDLSIEPQIQIINKNTKYLEKIFKMSNKFKINKSINNFIITNDEYHLKSFYDFIKETQLNKPKVLLFYLEKLTELLGDNTPPSIVYIILDLKIKLK
tara:strand:+ start:144 stop:3131 length:2988 start_codon:yes stop_codon:yes gene_type:complete